MQQSAQFGRTPFEQGTLFFSIATSTTVGILAGTKNQLKTCKKTKADLVTSEREEKQPAPLRTAVVRRL